MAISPWLGGAHGAPMTIGFPNASRYYDATRNAVHFWGHDQSMETSFFISAEALQRLMPEAAFNEIALLEAFDRNLARIRAAAARLYGSGRKGGSYDLQPSNF
jgi:hypothetical protein